MVSFTHVASTLKWCNSRYIPSSTRKIVSYNLASYSLKNQPAFITCVRRTRSNQINQRSLICCTKFDWRKTLSSKHLRINSNSLSLPLPVVCRFPGFRTNTILSVAPYLYGTNRSTSPLGADGWGVGQTDSTARNAGSQQNHSAG